MRHVFLCLSGLDTTTLVKGSGRAHLVGQSRVNRQYDPGQETILDGVAELDVSEDGVAGGGLDQEDLVVGIGRDRLGVGVVRVEQLDLVADALVPESLADMSKGGIVDGAVLADGGVGVVQQRVDVGGAAGVVTREDGVERGDALVVGGLEAAQPGQVEDADVVRVAVAGVGRARVDSSRVAV